MGSMVCAHVYLHQDPLESPSDKIKFINTNQSTSKIPKVVIKFMDSEVTFSI